MDAEAWVAVAFGLFIVVAAKFVWPKLAAMLDKRGDEIKNQIAEATNLKQQAEKLFADAEKKIKAAKKTAQQIVEDAQKEAEVITVNAEKEIEEDIARKTKQAQEKIHRAEQDAVERVKKQAVDFAAEAAKQAIVASLQAGGAKKKLIEDSVAHISKAV